MLTLEYDQDIPESAPERILELFGRESVLVEKKNKNGVTEQNITPMIQKLNVAAGEREMTIHCVVCCQNPSLNPMQLVQAIGKYLPDLQPDHVVCRRLEVYDTENNIFR